MPGDDFSVTSIYQNPVQTVLIPEFDYEHVEQLTYQFTDRSSPSPTAWYWSFGDGETSNKQNPRHRYQSEGVYTVRLNVTWDLGTAPGPIDGATEDTLHVAPPIAASFTYKVAKGSYIVDFTDTSTGGPKMWGWDFGDGTGSPEQNPSHEYDGPGNYDVRLWAWGSGPEALANRTVVVPPTTTIEPTPVLILSSMSGRPGSLVTVTGRSFNTYGVEFPQAVITFNGGRVVPDIVWITDGGFTASFTVPAGTLPGSYTVRASGPLNAANATFSVVIQDTPIPPSIPPVVVPTDPPTLILETTSTPPYTVSVAGTAVPGTVGSEITRITWDWGDGTTEEHGVPNTHTYATSGPYTVTVTAFQSDGQSTTRSLPVFVSGQTGTGTTTTPTAPPVTATTGSSTETGSTVTPTTTTVPPTVTPAPVTPTVTGEDGGDEFLWWLAAIIAVGLLAGGVAVAKVMGRRPPTPDERMPGVTIEARGGMRRPNSAGPPRRREAEVEIEVRGGMRREL